SVQDVNKICKQQQDMQTVMKRIKKMGMDKMMGMMKGLMGGKADELELMAQSMDPNGLGADMGAAAPRAALPGLGGMGLPGLGGGMPGMGGMGMPPFPMRGGTKKNRK